MALGLGELSSKHSWYHILPIMRSKPFTEDKFFRRSSTQHNRTTLVDTYLNCRAVLQTLPVLTCVPCFCDGGKPFYFNALFSLLQIGRVVTHFRAGKVGGQVALKNFSTHSTDCLPPCGQQLAANRWLPPTPSFSASRESCQ